MTHFYFELLDLDPRAEWSQEQFEDALQRKQAEWSNSSNGVGKRAVKAQHYLDLIPDIQRIMGDPVQRRAHIDEFFTKRHEELDREIVSYKVQRSTITRNELDKFVAEYQDVASKEEITTLLGIPISPPTTKTPQSIPSLDSSTMAAIREDLNVLDKDNLYMWLGLPQATGEQELYDAANRIYEDTALAMSPSSETLPQKRLAGFARIIFSAPEKRRYYDETLRLLMLDRFLEPLDRQMNRKSVPILSSDQMEHFLQNAQNAGISNEEAYNKLIKHAVRKDWQIPRASVDTDRDIQKRDYYDLLQGLLERKQYYAAQQFLNALKPDALDQKVRSSYRQRIHATITKAEKELAFTRGGFLFTSREEKIARCRTALGYCADYREAQDLLSELLPTPRNFQVSSSDPVLLIWDDLLQGAQYKVIRKNYEQPTTELDGQHLATIFEANYQDTNAPIGIPLYYAVFTLCNEVVSLTPATLRAPIFLTAEVTDVEVRFNDHLIELKWKNPPGLYNLVIRRKEKTAPLSIHDGIPIAVTGQTHLSDRSVRNHIIYYYVIYCQFKDHEGSIKTTEGVIVEAVAEVEMIRDLSIEHRPCPEGFNVQIRWSGSFSTGEVALLKTEDPPQLREGMAVAAADLHQHGEVLRTEQQPLYDFWSQSGVRYYTPLILFNDRAYIGAPHRHDCVEEVSNLTFQQLGNRVHLRWQWPHRCQEVNIFYQVVNTADASLHSRGSTYRMRREEYNYFGYAELKCSMNQNYTILVTTILEQGGRQMHSSGTSLSLHVVERMIIDYEIKRKILQKGLFIIFRTEAEISLPMFRVVCQQHRIPHHKEDGEVLFTSEEEPGFLDRSLSIALGELSCPPDTFARVFLEDENAASRLQFRLPRREKLRLS